MPTSDRSQRNDSQPAAPAVAQVSAAALTQPEAVQIKLDKLAPVKSSPVHSYWTGLTMDCPFSVAHVAGVDFSKTVEPPVQQGDTWLPQQVRPGRITRLTDAKVADILAAIQKKFIRRVGNKRAYMHSTDSAHYIHQASDENLAKFAYLMRVPDEAPMDWRPACKPIPMLSDGDGK